ncbi:hypothetical protein [Ferviditalea candida]|uniref:DUF1656 domain-containing protein n=1 Tax=Ferviditalea candida TaxID=3108399 RepID=A0ABU5ZGQ1_9BACL|nr:hypothetical protein [Paenibacillaceae bacterium T2]
MGLVDLSHVTPPFFITVAISIMLIFSFLSVGVLRFFQKRIRSGVYFVLGGTLFAAIFIVILNIFFNKL